MSDEREILDGLAAPSPTAGSGAAEPANRDDLDLLDVLLDAEGVAPSAAASISRRGLRSAPLSSAQERLWFLQQLDPLSTAYTITGAVLLRGALDVPALEAALAGVVARHEALRTTFEAEEGEPRQIVHGTMTVALERVRGADELDGAGGPPGDDAPVVERSEGWRDRLPAPRDPDPAERAASAAADLARRPWVLARGPLVRAVLVDLGPREHALTVAMHHIVADGASIGVLLRELGELYGARLHGAPGRLAEPPIQYTDYAAWQRERLAAGELEPQLAYWRSALAGSPAPLRLSKRAQGSERRIRRGATLRFDIDGAVAGAVEEAARRLGATPFAALFGCFAALVGRWSDRTDFVLGTPVANRGDDATAGLVGLFVNTVPIRADLSGDPALRDVVLRARDATRSALLNAEAPFDRIVEAVDADRRASRTPLFDVVFAYNEAPVLSLRLENLSVEPVDVDDETAKFDLILTVERRADRLACAIEYDVDLFDLATAERLADHYARLARALAKGGGLRLSEIDLPQIEAAGPSGFESLRGSSPRTAAPPDARAGGAAPCGAPRVPGSEDASAGVRRSRGAECEGGYVAPATPTEEIVSGIWAGLLGLDRVGATEDFFDLGGHSLLATRIVARLARALGVELPLRALFDAPTVRGLAGLVDSARSAPAPPIVRAPAEERRRPSYAQRRLWFLDRLEPASAAYNIANAVRLDGELDVEALARALSEIVRRHETLRTRFEEGPDGPLLCVDPPSPVPIDLVDLDSGARGDREREAARLAAATAREPFDLARGPLVRARLLKLGAAEHVLVLVVHHIASDGWSMGVLVSELAAAYAAFARAETARLEELPIQYADWAAWQRGWLDGGESERQLSWWRRELAGIGTLDLPTDRPRPAKPTYAGASLDVRLSRDLVLRLTRIARSEGATLHMVLLAAFAAVLARWSGQDEFGIGTPVANRTRVEAEPLIGFFVNTLVVRARLGGGRVAYRELLARIRESALGAYANQDVPFDRVVEALRPERDLSRTPLFQVMFILQNAPAGDLDLGGLTLAPFSAPTATSTFDLTLSLAPIDDRERRPEGLEGYLEYSTELFEETTVRRLWDHLVRLLETVANDPATELRNARLLDPGERARALDGWSGRGRIAAPGPLVHERFLEQARGRPEALAAVLGDRRVTYGEIAERSGRLAAHLAELGVGPESRVGLCVDRSPEMLVGMMATLRAGGAFVPLDPDHPRERIAFALEDSGAEVVLASRESVSRLGSEGPTIVRLDDPRSYGLDPRPSAARPSPEALAYIIYTSGTTGRPKGVMVSHGALAAAYTAWDLLYGLDGLRVHLQMAGIGFDVCTGDVVRALGSGARLVFCERDRLLDPARLLDLAKRERVEFAEFVPAVLRPLAAESRVRGERLDDFRIAVVGSDVWTDAEIEEFRAVFGTRARLANSYGVTEATIDSTCWFLDEGRAGAGSPPIGRPLAHGTVYVLDEALEPTPPGVIGELYVGGPAVARGYVGRPGPTAERFVPDPYGEPGARLYRTGDRARYLEDGRIVFAGRADDQTKIRGQRVEPAEIESALLALGTIAACAVVARKDAEGAVRLAAYVVPRGEAVLDADETRRRLRERLPEVMVPSAIVLLGELPQTPSGKVDRRRLPDPVWSAPAAYEPPSPGAETAVAAAFAGVLGLDRVGAGDDFFALGGHSLLATRVVSRLRVSLGVEAPLRDLFEAPTVRAYAARLGMVDGAVAPPVGRATDEARRRPSYAQRRLWLLDRLEPGSAAYNLPSSVRLEGDLDISALGRALSEIVRRHETMRTRFVEGPEGPETRIDPPAPLGLGVEDLSALAEADRRSVAERAALEEARRPFDLEHGPLVRARLLRLGPRVHMLLVTLHHIAADGWSLGVLVRELGALYGAYARGAESSLEPLAVQYSDWAAWQQAWLEAGGLRRQLEWWRQELENLPELSLPGDRARPARPTHAGAALELRLGSRLRERLERLARAEGATLHMALLAGYAWTLGRWSGQKDFAVGTPVANRRAVEAESLIGFFVNTLAIRARLGGRGLTFRGLLARVRGAALGAHENQDLPFERLVEELHPVRSRALGPLVQTLFVLQNAPVGEIALPGLSLVYEEPETGVTRFDIELFLAETPAGLEGSIHYSTELFDRETIERFAENFEAFLESAAADPDRALGDLPALAPPQLGRLLVEWNAAREEYDDPVLVHELFERRAALDPGAIAGRFGEESLTYGALNARANRLARLLASRGVGPGDLVAICLERSLDMLVALMGILKTGAAYVPVDPEYPQERIALVLDDAQAPVVLTQKSLAGRLPAGGAWILRLDEEGNGLAGEDPSDLRADVSADSLAYAVYTSGSTGRPKGVAMSHRAISNMLSWQRRSSGAEDPPRTLQFASLSFDVSFQEIFSTLTAGGEIVLVTEEERRDSLRLLRLIAERGIERLFVPFVALSQLAETAESARLYPACLREIDTAGEQLRITPAIAELFSGIPGCRLVNHYGPSETHLVTTFELEEDPSRWPELPPIGHPIPNAPVYLLDDEGRPVPIGARGEIYVGGAGLARGYHARPDLTAERFVPDPFSGEPGARLYRTGDLARFRADGNLEFLGRLDLQVKVRGHRVEPGEVESVLVRLPGVRRAVVDAREHGGGKRLVAWVVLEEETRVKTELLREDLARALPEFMLPSAIVVVASLPLTPNGKVDRSALPEPQWDARVRFVAPRTPEEEVVCGIYEEVLGVAPIGAADDFFALGGHSLLATRVLSRIRRALEVEVALGALFETPTPAGVAAAALLARRAGDPTPPPIGRASEPARRELSYSQRRLWFLDKLDPGSAVYNLPAAVRLEGELDVAAMRRALTRIVERHEALRTRYVEGRDGPEQRVDPPAEVELGVLDLSASPDPGTEARRIVADEAVRPFDLAHGPILRARLLRLGSREHVLSIVVHHISSDGWSMGILVRDLAALYGAEETDGHDAARAIQYADWAAWQRSWLEGGEQGRQLAWWRAELSGAPRALDLPTDRPRPALASSRGATLEARLSADLRGRLARFARSEGATLQMALLAGYAWTLLSQGGQREIVVGTPVANRRAAEAEELVGFFVNTLPIRVRADGTGLTWRGLLSRVRRASVGAYANQDVPFERIVEELQPERALNRAPIFQTAFALQSARLPAVELPGLAMTPLEIDTGTAKFDLMLTLEETGGGDLAGAFEYNTDIFDRETIEGLFSRFERILEGALAAPDEPLAALALLDDAEADRILAEWSVERTAEARSALGAPDVNHPDGASLGGVDSRSGDASRGDASRDDARRGGARRVKARLDHPALVHEWIERQAALTPDAPALATGANSWSYAELDERSCRLANHLRSIGVGPEARVAVLLDRSSEAIVALVAVLRAGGAFVPLEPGQPAERLRSLLEDCRAGHVVTETRFVERLAAGPRDLGAGTGSLKRVLLDDDADEIARAGRSRPDTRVRPENLAYVIYTSGSSGRPKGVCVEHRQIASYVASAIERLGIAPGWRFALVSTLAADLGHTSIFPALATGGCLHVLPHDLSFDAAGVRSYFVEHAIDALKIVPSHLQAILAGASPERVLPRRLLVLGGEATPGEWLASLAGVAPRCRLANHYGPTETTVGAVAGFLDAQDASRPTAPLGRPLANARAYLLDALLRPVPFGVPGDLFIGGEGVARGYLGRSDLTADRFIPDPFSPQTGARMYRTGDRALWLLDGRLEFLGRSDHQVKVRGYRVEPGEIAAAIESHPDVVAAAVIVRETPAGGPRLAAYVAPVPRRSPVVGGLARRRLPGGLAVAELNRHETDYIHREIFGNRAYVRHGIRLEDGDTVFDVGANAGLFSIFASLACSSPRLFAFEPNPHLLPILRANAAAYAPDATILGVGLSDHAHEASFTFFPGFSLLSGLHADPRVEKRVVKSFLENQGRTGDEGAARFALEADELLDERFAGRTIAVPLRTLSEVLADRGIPRIHLLKINVEKAELEVLRGIREADWERVDQTVVEVDVAANLGSIVSLLETHGFEVLVEQDPLLARTELRYVYAARRGSGRSLSPGAPPSVDIPDLGEPFLTADTLRAHLGRSLPEYMQPADWVFLEALPLTGNGKLDRAGLPAPVPAGGAYVPPRGEIERSIAAIWAEALGLDRVGAHDNFFDIGGHSLLLARVHARLQEAHGGDLSLIELFRYPTVASLAARLAGEGTGSGATLTGRDRGLRRRDAARARGRTRRVASPGEGA